MRISNILVKPIISEKSVALSKGNNYVFQVTRQATKGQIRQEVEKAYGVNVVAVRTVVLPGKKKRVGKTRIYTKTGYLKKAMVELKEGQKIDIFPKE